MVDWKWLGWTLASAAFTASTAVWALRTFLHLTDLNAVRWGGGVFVAVFISLVISRIRLNAWERQFTLGEDSTRPRHGPPSS
jgi:hypothetical protein